MRARLTYDYNFIQDAHDHGGGKPPDIFDREEAVARILIGGAAALAIASASLPSAAQDTTFVRIGSGVAGTYPIVGAKIAELLNENIDGIQATTVAGGTEANFALMAQGELELLLTYSFLSPIVQRGEGSLDVPTPQVRHLMSLYGALFQPAARDGVDIEGIADLDDGSYRVWGANATSIFFPMIQAALEANGTSFDAIREAGGVIEEIGYSDSAQAMQDGRLDVGFFSGPAPYSLLLQVENSPGFHLMGFDDAALAAYAELLPGTSTGTIPAGTYAGQDADVQVPYLTNQLVIYADVPDELAYEITRVLVENHEAFHGMFAGADEIRPEIMLTNNPIEVHPAAARYYEEAGISAPR